VFYIYYFQFVAVQFCFTDITLLTMFTTLKQQMMKLFKTSAHLT